MSDENEIKESLALIQKAVLALDKKITNQGKRIERLEKGSSVAENNTKPFEAAKQDADLDALKPEIENYWKGSKISGEEQKVLENTSASLEENIGGTWFARIGVVALVLGVSFLLKYAFDNNWIGDTGKIIIGILIGLGLLAIGEKTIRKYFVYGQIITGGGIAILYLSIFSAYNFYHLIGSFVAFFIMTIITIVGILLSVRYDAFSLVMVSTIGGFATPIMASSGQNNEVGLLSYLLLLDLGILAVSFFKRWHWLNFVGYVGTLVLFLAWGDAYYTRNDLGVTMFFLTIFFIVYSISAFIYNIARNEKSTGAEQLLTLLVGATYFITAYNLLNREYHLFIGFLGMILAIYYFIWAYTLRESISEDRNISNFLAFLTVGFVTLAIGIQFSGHTMTILWAIEAVILSVIASQARKIVILIFSLVIFVLTFLRYLMFDGSSYGLATTPIFNGIFFTAVILVACLYLAGFVISQISVDSDFQLDKKSLFIVFMIAANLLTIMSISKEITNSYDNQISLLHSQRNYNYSYNYGNKYDQSYKVANDQITKLENKSSISLSVFWLIYAIILLAIGTVGRYKGVRIGGLALLILAILKLFFVDLWSLGSLYRIISSMTLGVVLLLISFAYQKYKQTFSEIIN